MPLTLHNSMSRSDDAFAPREGDEVRVYACGPTIYGRAHIGNFRSFAVYDLFHRYLAWKGWTPKFVVNLTDVDDKTIRGAREAGVELEFLVPAQSASSAVSGSAALPDPEDSVAGKVARKLARQGKDLQTILSHLETEQNVKVTRDWVREAIEA